MNTPKAHKKILRIRKDEYMLAMEPSGVVTTFDKSKAMDISGWTTTELGYVISNLKRVGLKSAKIETVEQVEEDKTAVLEEKVSDFLSKETEGLSPELRKKQKDLKKLMEESAKLTKKSGLEIGEALKDVYKKAKETN